MRPKKKPEQIYSDNPFIHKSYSRLYKTPRGMKPGDRNLNCVKMWNIWFLDGLTRPAQQIFFTIFDIIKKPKNRNTLQVTLDIPLITKRMKLKSDRQVLVGIKQLTTKSIIARKSETEFHINPDIFFHGNRAKIQTHDKVKVERRTVDDRIRESGAKRADLPDDTGEREK